MDNFRRPSVLSANRTAAGGWKIPAPAKPSKDFYRREFLPETLVVGVALHGGRSRFGAAALGCGHPRSATARRAIRSRSETLSAALYQRPRTGRHAPRGGRRTGGTARGGNRGAIFAKKPRRRG